MQITKKLIVTNTLWSAVAQGGVMLISLLVLPLFIQNLGVEIYGIWVISGVVMGYLNVFDFGFTHGLQKYVAEARVKGDHQELSEVVVSGFGLLVGLGLLIGGICFFWAQIIVEFFNIQPANQLIARKMLQISALFCVFMWPLRIAQVILYASMKISVFSICEAVKLIIQSMVMLGMLYFGASVITIKWVTSTALLLFSLPAVYLACKTVPTVNWAPSHFCARQLRKMSGFSLGMFYLAILGALSVKVDTLILGRMIGMASVTIYTIVGKPYEIIQRICGMAMLTLIPASFNLLPTASAEQRETLIIKAVRYRTLVLAPMSAAAIIMVPGFIRLWVGDEYVRYAIWGQFFVGVNLFMGIASLGNVARAAGAMKLVNLMLSVKVAINVFFSIILIGRYGVGGVILGTVISNAIFGEIIFGYWICKKIGVRFLPIAKEYWAQTLLCIFLAAILLCLNTGSYVTTWTMFLSVGAGIYGLILFLNISCFFLREVVLLVKKRG